MAENSDLWGRIRREILRISKHEKSEHMIADAEGLACWVEQHISERDARIVELEAQVAAFRAPAEAAGYTVSEDGKCWTGNGGGREFFQGPPINVTHGEDPGDYLERLRAGEEPGTVDHLSAARDWLATHLPEARSNEDAIAAAAVAKAHALIAQTERMDEHHRLIAESVDLQRQAVEDRQQADAALMELATREPPPHIRYGCRVFQYGDSWCCLFGDCIAEDPCAFGLSPKEACAAFDRFWLTGSAEESEPE